MSSKESSTFTVNGLQKSFIRNRGDGVSTDTVAAHVFKFSMNDKSEKQKQTDVSFQFPFMGTSQSHRQGEIKSLRRAARRLHPVSCPATFYRIIIIKEGKRETITKHLREKKDPCS